MDFKCDETLHKSLTYIIKRDGPRIDHCGTPQVTLWTLSVKKHYISH